MPKKYDCIIFFNEIDLLEIRLSLLYPHVDFFIISESDCTFSGIKKPFYFLENKEKFKPYEDKIIYLKNTNTHEYINIENRYSCEKALILNQILSEYESSRNSPKTDYGKPHWCREYLQREFVKLGMSKCLDDDIIILSDLDEIPDPQFLNNDPVFCFKQKNMIYHLNKENKSEEWYGSIVTRFCEIKNKSLNSVRAERLGYKIIEGGWHLSFMGGEKRISQKIESYGHQEFNTPRIHSNISVNLEKNQDVLCRNLTIKKISMDDYYPGDLISLVQEKYPYLIDG